MISKAVEKIKTTKFFSYVFFGGIAAMIELGSFIIMNTGLNINYLFAAPISFILAASSNYAMQRKFTFKSRNTDKKKEYSIFMIIAFGGMLFNSMITIIGVEILGLIPTFAKILAIFLSLAYNYTMNNKITFKQKNSE